MLLREQGVFGWLYTPKDRSDFGVLRVRFAGLARVLKRGQDRHRGRRRTGERPWGKGPRAVAVPGTILSHPGSSPPTLLGGLQARNRRRLHRWSRSAPPRRDRPRRPGAYEMPNCLLTSSGSVAGIWQAWFTQTYAVAFPPLVGRSARSGISATAASSPSGAPTTTLFGT